MYISYGFAKVLSRESRFFTDLRKFNDAKKMFHSLLFCPTPSFLVPFFWRTVLFRFGALA